MKKPKELMYMVMVMFAVALIAYGIKHDISPEYVKVYTADWCGTCPHYIEDAQNQYDSVQLINVDTLSTLEVRSVPTIKRIYK